MLHTESFNILIVDDNSNNLFTLRNLIIEHIDAKILEAGSGLSALQILLQETVDLIILDVQMPDMDGFETAKLIRSRKKTQHVPIVFLTAAYKADEFKKQGLELGAADYLTKPIDAPELISRIRSYLRFIEQERRYTQELEHKVQVRTTELLEANRLLEETRNSLERRVQERTLELSQANKDLKMAKETAEHARVIAESANLAKSRFLANMSHELRTPLNAIIGYSEILIEDAEEIGQTDSIPDLKKILTSGEHLLSLIDDILDVSKIETGKIELRLETFELAPVLDKIINIARPLIEKGGSTLMFERVETLGTMHTDLVKLRRILLNLLNNAAKFTEHGFVYMRATRMTRQTTDWISFCIADSGIGMTEEQRDKLFETFTQADNSPTRKYGGTGLGLAITKNYVQLMGGTIEVDSEYREGSIFIVELPAIIQASTVQQLRLS